MNTTRLRRPIALLMFLTALCTLSAQSHAAAACAGEQFCTEVATFTAAIADFRTSVTGAARVATATVRLANKTGRPLVLGYVHGSGVVIDDQGNRYEIDTRNENNVRAIGVITRSTFDPKFSLQPGENSDARFQFSWYPGKKIAGTVFQLEMTIREIDAAAGNQQQLGREHSVHFRNLTDGALAAQSNSPPTSATSAAPAAAVATNAAAVDPCASLPRCYSAGPFTAQIAQLTTSQARNMHLVRTNVRFRNLTSQPLILAYTINSGSLIDNYGNRYIVDSRFAAHVQGIGQTARNKADPQFVLNPGESRSAVFEYSRYVGKTAIGTVFTPELAVEQLEILPSQQIRSTRQYSLSFADLTAGAMLGDGGDAVNAVNNINEAGKQLTDGLKSLFKKK